MHRLKAIIKNILALLLGLTLALGTLEVMLRVFQPVEYRIRGNKIVLPRNKKYIFPNNKFDRLDKVIHYSRNNLGFRGEPPPADFAHTLTILTVGGSTTECLLISDGKTWSDRLASRLKGEFKPLWLNNAGLDGTSTFGHLVLLKDYLIQLKPKVVLFLVGANDIGLQDFNSLDKKSMTKPAASFINTLAAHSLVADYALNFFRYYKAKKSGLVHTNIDFAHLKTLDLNPGQEQAILQKHRRRYLKPYAKRLQKLIDVARQHGIEPVFLTQPMIYGEVIDPVSGADLRRVDIGGINGKTDWEIMQLYNGVLRQVAAKNQVPLIDLAAEMPKSSAYFYDTFHFTNEGCRLVAKIIAEHLAPILAQEFPRYVSKQFRASAAGLSGQGRGQDLKRKDSRAPSGLPRPPGRAAGGGEPPPESRR
jgi:lysophospholipase L1-like esterase